MQADTISDSEIVTASLAIGQQLEKLGVDSATALHQGFVVVEHWVTLTEPINDQLIVYQELYLRCHAEMFNDGFEDGTCETLNAKSA